jgi:glycosyltransferase involved in cell wall biosynthesis
MIFWICTIFILSLFLLYLATWFLIGEKKTDSEKYNPVYDISLVIPFRNEAQNLPKLLDSISKLPSKPKEIIFVNDHSEDNSIEILKKSALSIDILHLEAEIFGKKQALHKGIQHADCDYILTWDADVEIPSTYFEVIAKQYISDLLILPVKMQAFSFLGFFASLDYYFLNAISFACGKFSQNIVASGANLLFKKDLYFSYCETQKTYQFASGDDAFLLQFAKENGAKITTVLDSELCVKTESPSNIQNFIQQRLRWIGKSKAVGDKFAFLIGVLGVLYQVNYVVLVLNYPSFWEMILLSKILVEILIFLPYVFKIKHGIALLFSPFFSLIYSFYMLLIGVVSLFWKVKWKGREV